jgi:hypothetical protein
MRVQDWIFTVCYCPEGESALRRHPVVGPARASTVEAALHLAGVPEPVRAEIRADEVVRKFVEGRLDPQKHGYYTRCPIGSSSGWVICIGSIQAVLS